MTDSILTALKVVVTAAKEVVTETAVGAEGAAAGEAGEGGWEDVSTKQESGRRCGRAHTGGERGLTLMEMLNVDEGAEMSIFDFLKDVLL